MKYIFFTTCKPFRDEFKWKQEQSIRSWLNLNCDKLVLIIGNDEGTKEFCDNNELCIHEPNIKKQGSVPYVKDMFYIAEKYANDDDIIIWTNADMMYSDDIINSTKHINSQQLSFVLVGQRWDWNHPRMLNELNPNLIDVKKECKLHAPCGIDYLITKKNIITSKIHEDLLIAGTSHDMKMLGYAISNNIFTCDLTQTNVVIHHNHTQINRSTNEFQSRLSNNMKTGCRMMGIDKCQNITFYDENGHIQIKQR